MKNLNKTNVTQFYLTGLGETRAALKSIDFCANLKLKLTQNRMEISAPAMLAGLGTKNLAFLFKMKMLIFMRMLKHIA